MARSSFLHGLGRALGLISDSPAPYRAAPDRHMADAFGQSFELPPEMRYMTQEQLATSDLTRQQVRMAQGLQDYFNAKDGKAVPIRTFIQTEALFSQWKRGPGGAAEGHFRGPGASLPGFVAASNNRDVGAVLTTTRPRMHVSMRVVDEGQMADRLGATRMPGQPTPTPLSPARLRPVTQRNAPVATDTDVLRLAMQGAGQDPRGSSAEQIQQAIGRAAARRKGY